MATKEPWQMTKDGYAEAQKQKSQALIEAWNKAGSHGIPPTAAPSIYEIAPLAEKAGYVMPRDAEKVLQKTYHRLQVEAAIHEGKPVPPEVLKDYPELTKTIPPNVPVTPRVITPEEQLQILAIKQDPVSSGEKLGYHIRKLLPKEAIDKGLYAEGYRYQVGYYPDMFMAKSEKELSDYILGKARRIVMGHSPKVLAPEEEKRVIESLMERRGSWFVPPSIMQVEGRYSLTELKEMARKANIDPRGDKDQLCRRLIKEGVIR